MNNSITPKAPSIISEYYFNAADGVVGAEVFAVGRQNDGKITDHDFKFIEELKRLTICVLHLEGGGVVSGSSMLGPYAAKEKAIQEVQTLSVTQPPIDNANVAPDCEQFSADVVAANKAAGDFGYALTCLKAGSRVAREGWNGKGMWLSLSCDNSRRIPAASFWSRNNIEYAMTQPLGQASVLPCITMKTATGEILMGWLASQTDMLANDWVVLE
jgi:Protein of unknown function (DUF2829)